MQRPTRDAITAWTGAFRSRRHLVTMIAVVCGAVSTPSAAYPKTMREKMQAACTADVARLCPRETLESEGLKGCMLQHRSEVAPACMKLIDASE